MAGKSGGAFDRADEAPVNQFFGEDGFGRSFSSEATTIIDAGSADTIIVDAELLFTGDYSREGPDLLISGQHGDSLVVEGFFSTSPQPVLASSSGALVLPDTANALAGPIAPAQFAQTTLTPGASPIGEVKLLEGGATLTRSDGTQIILTKGAAIFQSDVIQTADGSKLTLLFIDGTALSMSANARMIMDELIYNPDATDNSMVLNLIEGTFVFVTGQIAKTGDVTANTPVATMGIRGTTPTVSIDLDSGAVKYGIAPDPDGTIGSYILINLVTGQVIGTVNSPNTIYTLASAYGVLDLTTVDPATLDTINSLLANTYSTFGSGSTVGPGQENGEDGQQDNGEGTDGNTDDTGENTDGTQDDANLNSGDGFNIATNTIDPLTGISDPEFGDPLDGGDPAPGSDESVPPPDQADENTPPPPANSINLNVGNFNVLEDGATTLSGFDISFNGNLTVTITAGSILTLNSVTGLTFLAGSNGSNFMQFTGSSADIQQALNLSTYEPTADLVFGTLDIVFTDTANGGVVGAIDVPITVIPVEDPPTAGDFSFNVVAGQTEVTLPFLGSFDPDTNDPGSTQVLSFSITNPDGSDVAIAASGTEFTISVGDLLDFAALIDGGLQSFSFEFQISDGDQTDNGLVTINFQGVNDAPTAGDDTFFIFEDDPPDDFDFAGDDPDSDDSQSTLTYTFSSFPALGSVINNNDGTFTFDPGTDFDFLQVGNSIDIEVTYQATDSHGVTSNTGTLTFTVEGENDAPVVTAVATLDYVENAPASVIDNTITVSDVDDTNIESATAQITGNYVQGEDFLDFVSVSGITASFNAATGTLDLSGTATVAEYQAALRTVVYNNTSEAPSELDRTITFTVNDGDDDSIAATSTVTVEAVNDAPILDLDENNSSGSSGTGFNNTFTEGSGPVHIGDSAEADLSIGDVDDTNMESVTVTLTNPLDGGVEFLTYTGTPPAGVVVSGNGTSVITLTGSASKNLYNEILENIFYQNSSENPDETDRIIEVVVSDGNNDSNTAIATISVVAVNDAPVISVSQANLIRTADESFSGNQQHFAGSILNNDLINNGQASLLSVTVANYTPFAATSTGAADIILNDGVNGDNSNPTSGAAFDLDGDFQITYTFDLTTNSLGYDLTRITSYAAHADNRTAQDYEVLVDFVFDGLGNFVSLGTFTGTNAGGANQASRVTLENEINPGVDAFASGVAAIRFDFNDPVANATTVWRELDVEGSATVAGTTVVGTDEDTAIVISGVSVFDVDAGTADITVTLEVTDGTLTVLAGVGGGLAAGVIVATNGGKTITLTGTIAEINTTLADANGLTYLGDADFNGTDTLTITADDGGATGSGGAQTDVETIDITVTSVNDAPEINLPRGATFGGTDADFTIVNPVDAALPTGDFTVSFWLNDPTLDNTSFESYISYAKNGSFFGNDIHIGGANGSVFVVIFDTVVVQTPVNAVPADGNFHNISFTFNTTTGAGELFIDGVSVATGTGTAGTLVGGGSLVFGQDQDSIGGGFDTNQALTGSVADIAFYDGELNAGQIAAIAAGIVTPTNANIFLRWNDTTQAFEDISGGSNDMTTNGNVTTTTGPLPTPLEDNVATVSGVQINDVDAGSDDIEVTLSVNNGASVDLTDLTGLTVTNIGGDGLMVFTGSQTAINTALANSITVTPADDFNGTVTLSVTANDQGNNGTGGALSDVETFDIVFTPVNDAPVALPDTASATAITVPSVFDDIDAIIVNDNAASALGTNATQLLTNDGSGGLTAATAVGATSARNSDVKLADFDGDGDLDAVTSSFQVLENLGGTFSTSIIAGTTGSAQGLAVGDIDGDGDIDILAANWPNTANQVLINQGGAQGGTEGVFVASTLAGGGNHSRDIALADVDGDGDLDAIVANDTSINQLLINQGGIQGGTEGAFNASNLASLENQAAIISTDITFADVDGDGDLDALIANAAGQNELLTNDGNGNFSAGLLAGGNFASTAIAAGDLDGDGDIDLVVTNNGGEANQILINQGLNSGTFVAANITGSNGSSSDVALVDIDGDGDLDAFITNNGFSTSAQDNQLLINDGAGNFTVSSLPGGGNASNAIAFGDLDGDGAVAAVDANGLPNINLSPVTGSVAANDSDVDAGAVLTYALVAPIAGLTLLADGSYVFDPSDPAYASLAAGATLAVVADYTVTDENSASDQSTLTITVTGTNDAPAVDVTPVGITGAEFGGALGDNVVINPVVVASTADDFAFTLWLNDPSLDQTTGANPGEVYASYAIDPANPKDFQLFNTAAGLAISIGSVEINTGISIPQGGEWVHLAVNYDAANGAVEVFLDGASQGVFSGFPTGGLTDGGSLVLGNAQSDAGITANSNQAFQGSLGEVAFWDGQLTQQQIFDLTEDIVTPGDALIYLQWDSDTSQFTDLGGGNAVATNGDVTTDPGSFVITPEDVPIIISGVEISDADLAGGDIEITLSVNNGAVSLTDLTGLTVTDPGGDATMVFTGSLAAVNAALASSILFTPDPDSNFTNTDVVKLSIAANDGATSNPIDSQEITIYVFPVNDVAMVSGIGQKITAFDGVADDQFGKAVAVNSNGTIVVGAENDDDNGLNSGSVYVYVPNATGGFEDAIKLTAPDGVADDLFGRAVAINANGTIVVGAHFDDDNGTSSGSIYVYEPNGSGGYDAPVKLTAPDGAAFDVFGEYLAINDNGTIVVSSVLDDDNGMNSGSIYVFEPNGVGGYNAPTKLSAADGAADDNFGAGLSINSSGTIIVGAPLNDDSATSSGSAYIFTFDGSTYDSGTKIGPGDPNTGGQFGDTVALNESGTFVVGAPGDDAIGSFAGAAYIFNSAGVQTAKLTASDEAALDNFGISVAINKHGIIVVGADLHDANGAESGAVYVFNSAGIQLAKLTAPDGAADDNFGTDVYINDDGTITVGANRDDDNGAESGSVYIFVPDGAGGYNALSNIPIIEGDQGVTSIQTIDLATLFTGSDIDDGETPIVDPASIVITPQAGSALNTALPFNVNGSVITCDSGVFDFMNTGDTSTFDVTFDVVSGPDVVSRTIAIQINGLTDNTINVISGSAIGETLNGTAANDLILGNGADPNIFGDDQLFGFGGDDVLFGSDANEIFDGGDGNDTIFTGDNNPDNGDFVFASIGNDRINFSGIKTGFVQVQYGNLAAGIVATINGNLNTATIDKGVNGIDTLIDVIKPLAAGFTTGGLRILGTSSNDTFILDNPTGTWMEISGGDGIDSYTLNSGGLYRLTFLWDDSFGPTTNGANINLSTGTIIDDGFGNTETITGTGQVWEIRGTDFNDTLIGSANDESFIGEQGDDFIDGGAGFDRVRYDRGGVDGIDADLDAGTVTGTWDGFAFTDTLVNIEWLRGSNSADTILGSGGDERLQGRGGNDSIDGGGGNDDIFGDSGNDTLAGGLGADNISGGSGLDLIAGGSGLDKLSGGADKDTFIFGLDDLGDIDLVTDFEVGLDQLDLQAFLGDGFNTALIGDFVELDAIIDGAGDFTGAALSIDQDGAGTGFMFEQIATLAFDQPVSTAVIDIVFDSSLNTVAVPVIA